MKLRVRCHDCGAGVVEYGDYLVTCPNRKEPGWGVCGIEVRAMFETVCQPDQWRAYLETPAPIFGGETAAALIERGDTDRVMAALDQLASGAFI